MFEGFRLSIALKGYSQASKKLETLMGIAKRPSVPARQCAVWLAGQTIRVFADGGRPEKWAPLSMMTLFIRSHREGAQNNDALPMNDTGRLKGSFIPVIEDDGNRFGASTNVEYAGMMQSGGISEPREVSIAAFTRSRGASQAKDYSRGSLTKATGRVKAYIMHMKGGNKIPARPFFPEGIQQLDAWGYHEKIKQIFREYFRDNAVGGTA